MPQYYLFPVYQLTQTNDHRSWRKDQALLPREMAISSISEFQITKYAHTNMAFN